MKNIVIISILLVLIQNAIYPNNEFSNFLNLYPEMKLPFTVKSYSPLELNDTIPNKLISKHTTNRLEQTDIYYDRIKYYPVARFEWKEFIGTIFLRHEFPGSGGYEAYLINLSTFDRKGTLIDKIEFSCYCRTSDINLNELLLNEVLYTVTEDGITVTETETHQNLFEEETDPKYRSSQDTTFYNEKINRFYIKIDSQGVLKIHE